jgi:hypothetical protein
MDAYMLRVPGYRGRALLDSLEEVQHAIRWAETHRDHKLELGEAWAGLHFLLTGELPIPREEALSRGVSWDENSLENVLMGGRTTPYLTSWGPARYLSPYEVARLASKLSKVSVNTIRNHYDPKGLSEEHIPPDTWDEPGTREWLASSYSKLICFYAEAASTQDGLLIYFV